MTFDLSVFKGESKEDFQPDKSNDLDRVYRSVIEHAIRLHGMGEDISYDWGLTIAPGSDGQVMPVYVLTMQMPTLVIGQMAQTFSILQAAGITKDGLEELVGEAIGNLKSTRDDQARLLPHP